MRKITIDKKYTKTYKTVKNLEKALDALNLPDSVSYLQTEVDGRFTAVFCNISVGGNNIYLSMIAHNGFKIIG